MMRDLGAPHAPPFSGWNAELRRAGPGKPVLVLDMDALDANLDRVKRTVAAGLAVRVVAKSLPSVPLLRYAMERLGTSRLMVFDDSVTRLSEELPEADLLTGKPLPVQAVAAFYEARGKASGGDPGGRVQWLADTPERLAQYAGLARGLGVRMRVSLEVDVGLHRGGATTPDELRALLRVIAADPAHLSFAGLMGYDAHVTSAPPILSSLPRAFEAATARYRAFRDAVREHDPSLEEGDPVWNGGGSKTYMLHPGAGDVNEVALGSCLVKPTDFDVPTLAAHEPALFVAAPVLKVLRGVRVPFLEWAARAWAAVNPNRQVTYFLFGGGWMAKPVSPAGLSDNPVYGFSTNQAMLNGSAKTALLPDDWVFFRPTQSERVMQEFGALRLVRGGHLDGTWGVLGFSP
jgi:D-serine deaminase-like pyridoxal phosphate-dependent protein